MSSVFSRSETVLAALIMLILGIMMIPLPPVMMDILLSLNISLAIITLMVTLSVTTPLDFSVFPTLILIMTIFRIALEIAATRLILLHAFAGEVIYSFGNFVVGGNYVVGLIIFLILIVIQYLVITSGATRTAEVAARFTLDSMPGKQMGIDADLNAGLINDDQARERRRDIQREADFYGSMDGASKFVRGDAISAIVIMFINIIGGFIIGIVQHNMDIGQALSTYTLLTVGEGLVSQIPALLLSTSTGIIITRASSKGGLGSDTFTQMVAQPSAILFAALIMLIMGLIPGLPKLPFFILAAAFGFAGYLLVKKGKEEAISEEESQAEVPVVLPPVEIDPSILKVETLELEMGYSLVQLADVSRGEGILHRLALTRRKLSEEMGFIVPPIRVRDNLQLNSTRYQVKIRGNIVAVGDAYPNKLLAMPPAGQEVTISGIKVKEPVFGLNAVWIDLEKKEVAELSGYTVVDPSSVIVTHMTEVIKSNAVLILGRQETSTLIDSLKTTHPVLVEEVVPELLSIGDVQKVLHALLSEGISIRDMVTIFEALADNARQLRDVATLTEAVRKRIGKSITQIYEDSPGEISAIVIDANLEGEIYSNLTENKVLDNQFAQTIVNNITASVQEALSQGKRFVVLTTSRIRPHIRTLTLRALPKIPILSFEELDPNVKLKVIATVKK
ncbi:flagellar biosynthesis protein FlhA [Thermodesulfobium sp. 4217-1]|uniref:flagellar biosynthesis protein FlhA n=1 Tax=Thermodesulfobium sp. 4217-1 TaxID=3120013 RepID=UPI003221479B